MQWPGPAFRFDRFYSGAPVFARPTRGSALTGRHPFRYGIFFANADTGADSPSKYALPAREQTLPELLKPLGYTAGHFGKWHLGDFTGPQRSAPTDNGFDEFFSTTRKVRTVDPEAYWTQNGRVAAADLKGDDSRILMDAAVAFIEKAAQRRQPFLAVIWFHAPHEPVVATERHRAPYTQYPARPEHYYGAIASLDEQMGRLRETLRYLKIERNTMLWYASDNGPEGDSQSTKSPPAPLVRSAAGNAACLKAASACQPCSNGPPVSPRRKSSAPAASTSDYLPTILSALATSRFLKSWTALISFRSSTAIKAPPIAARL